MFTEYEKLLKRVDEFTERLSLIYKGHLPCKKGCASCCMPGLTLFPVEAYYIQSQTSVVPKNSKKHCCFLEKNLCLIYEARPLVCRTQGFPLLYKSLDEKSFELSHCELCFTKWKGEFLSQNVLNMENLNTMLSVVNMEFLKAMGKFDELKSKRFMMFEIEKIK